LRPLAPRDPRVKSLVWASRRGFAAGGSLRSTGAFARVKAPDECAALSASWVTDGSREHAVTPGR